MAETKKSRKFGRNKLFCEGYRRAEKHTRSHIRRVWRHLQRQHERTGEYRDRMAVHYFNNSNLYLRQLEKLPIDNIS